MHTLVKFTRVGLLGDKAPNEPGLGQVCNPFQYLEVNTSPPLRVTFTRGRGASLGSDASGETRFQVCSFILCALLIPEGGAFQYLISLSILCVRLVHSLVQSDNVPSSQVHLHRIGLVSSILTLFISYATNKLRMIDALSS